MGEALSILLAGVILYYSFRTIYGRIRQKGSGCQHCAMASACKQKENCEVMSKK
ncbi:hypothetical protein [Rubeoparvulum massiliense]|uniref:hypothetical protein n=1 Tax=Rubeoparvulum massiliense TaxID=1631346 RepID=UPI0012E02BAF|nr:hypothetical protein [Rubeoparvulum massiliense]